VFGLLAPTGRARARPSSCCSGLIFPTRGSASILAKAPQQNRHQREDRVPAEESYLYPLPQRRGDPEILRPLCKIDRRTLNRRVPELLDIRRPSTPRRASKPAQAGANIPKAVPDESGLAQARSNNPLILLDEPTTGLEPHRTREIRT